MKDGDHEFINLTCQENMDQETREFLDRRFNGIDGKFEEIKRYFGVVAEGLRNEIRQVAEGHEVIRNEIRALREDNDAAHGRFYLPSSFPTLN